MAIISVIGPKGGIGKTTLSINTTAAITRALGKSAGRENVCLVDLDLRLPTISSLLDSHPRKTFYDLFETLANHTYQADFLRSLYQIITRFNACLEGDLDPTDDRLAQSFSIYKNLNPELFHFGEFEFSTSLQELFLMRGDIRSVNDLPLAREVLQSINPSAFRQVVQEAEANSHPVPEEYINFIEEYGFNIIGGEVPVLGKRAHRKRVNEPAFLLLFLDFLNQVCNRFEYTLLDTPAGGVNHLSSLMNVIDQVLFVFDLSNTIAINGSIDALHSFIDYYEDFYADFQAGRLNGLDRDFVNKQVAEHGENAVLESMKSKKFGILFNRCSDSKELTSALGRLRDYLDTLDKYESYKDRIHIVGLLPHHKIINITNNRGALFYEKDMALTGRMDMVANYVLDPEGTCPTLSAPDKEIEKYLNQRSRPPLARIAGGFA